MQAGLFKLAARVSKLMAETTAEAFKARNFDFEPIHKACDAILPMKNMVVELGTKIRDSKRDAGVTAQKFYGGIAEKFNEMFLEKVFSVYEDGNGASR